MTVIDQILSHISSLPDPKRGEMQSLHERILQLVPGCRLWFSDGKNEAGKVIANPTIGYGAYTARYANGASAEQFRVGLSANTTGISVYVMGIADKAYLAETYGARIGKASVTGYCIRFKKLADIDVGVLEEAINGRLSSEGEPNQD